MLNHLQRAMFKDCWEKDILPSDLGYDEWDYEYLSGNKWFTYRGQVYFFD